jgi:single-strand DNA-binding protein
MDALVHVSGNVGAKIDYRKRTDELDAWATFSIAHTPSYRRGEEWVELPTTWLNVNCRRSLARNVSRSINPGDPVLVTGKLRTRTWEDAQTKETRTALYIDAESVGPDLLYGQSTFQRTKRKDDEAQGTRALRGGNDDPWQTPTESATDSRTGEVTELHPDNATASVADTELEPAS